jgi:hypothetical protein
MFVYEHIKSMTVGDVAKAVKVGAMLLLGQLLLVGCVE